MVVDRTVVVVAGGGTVQVDRNELVGAAAVVAADVGVAEARRLGLHVDLLVGDLDSASQDDVRWVEEGGGTVRRHPPDKDATDLELALDEAVARRAERILVLGGADGRLDHTVGNALMLGARRFARLRIDAWFGTALLHVIHDRRELRGRPGELLSLFALGGPAQGVRTTGLRWSLDGDELHPGSSRGTSNQFVGDRAVVEVAHGVLLAVRPGEEVPR
jgi:thiamine pyrophosphokinase